MTPSYSNATGTEAVLIPPGLLSDLHRVARSELPRECCGALIGQFSSNGDRTVTAILPAENEWPTRQPNRYLLSAVSVRKMEESARRADSIVLGFYHSHPDYGVRPSGIDLAYAWPWYTYLIVAGEAPMQAAWRLREDRSGFVRQELRVMAASAMRAAS